jgi:opacity protein-like surface antigen
MMKLFTAAALAATLLAAPALAEDELQDYAEAGGWAIAIDPSLNNGCLMYGEFEDNSVVRIGIDMTTGFGYILSANPAWGDIVEGQSYPVTIALDDKTFEGEAVGYPIDDMPGANVDFDNPDFLALLVAAQNLTLSHDGNEVMSLDISGSADAVKTLIECQDKQNAASAG